MQGRTLGFILAGAGVVLGVAIGLWLSFAYQAGDIEKTGAVFGAALLGGAIVLPLIGGGVFFIVKGTADAENLAHVQEQRRLLDIVKTRGQVQISDLVLELSSTTDTVKADLYDLVGRGLFSGYVDWEKGMLYSMEASKLSTMGRCPNCGGELELGGKGVVKCPYCGSEIFL